MKKNAYVYFPNRPEAVADINDWIGIYAYKQDTDTKLHSAVWGTRQRTIREKFNTRFKDARKSFSTTLKHFERENEMHQFEKGQVIRLIEYLNSVEKPHNEAFDPDFKHYAQHLATYLMSAIACIFFSIIAESCLSSWTASEMWSYLFSLTAFN